MDLYESICPARERWAGYYAVSSTCKWVQQGGAWSNTSSFPIFIPATDLGAHAQTTFESRQGSVGDLGLGGNKPRRLSVAECGEASDNVCVSLACCGLSSYTNSAHWHEHTRDLLNIIGHYLPANITVDLPLHLPRIFGPDRFTHGFSSRKLVMVGHSFGGCISTLAAIFHPVLFDALLLIDPVILEPKFPAGEANKLNALALGALGRRDIWNSR